MDRKVARLRSKIDATQQVYVSRVRAEILVTRIEFEPRQSVISCLISFFEPLERLLVVAESRCKGGYASGWNILCFVVYFFLCLVETLSPVALRTRLPQSDF